MLFFQYSLFLSLPIPIFIASALVVLFLAFCQTDFELGAAFVPMQIQWYERKALAFHGANQTIELLAVHQQFAVPGRVRLCVGRRGFQRREMRAEQPGFTATNVNVTLSELHISGTQTLHFPAFEHKAGLKGVLDKVVVPCLAI